MYPKITFTMTTFKRFKLFVTTMNSFLDTCLDRDLICKWIVSDDGSDPVYIKMMKTLYPFLTIVKNPGIGQAANLNNLFSLVDTEYFFHSEDDWLFKVKDNYIWKMMDVMFENPKIKNITLRYWEGGESAITSTGVPYNIHIYNPDVPKEEICKNDAWWCGYTLNPGMQHKPTVDLLGKYDEALNPHKRNWDRPQAIKYSELGLKRGNLLNPNYIEHLGDSQSAYTIRVRENANKPFKTS